MSPLATAPFRPPPLIPQERVAARVRMLASEVDARFAGSRPLLVGVLTGAYVFVADLSREIRVPHDVAFVRAGSYGNATTPVPDVALQGVAELSVAGRDVLVVEDVLDTGHTLTVAVAALAAAGARSVATCVLVVKDRPRPYPVDPDIVGFVVAPRFVVGYGIDCRGAWRHLPYLAVVDEEA